MSSSRKCTGRLFQRRGPAAAKLLSPNVLCVRHVHDHSVGGRADSTSWTFRNQVYHVVSQVRRCLAGETDKIPLAGQRRVNETCQLEVDTSLDRKPVQMTKNWRDVVPSSSSREKPSGGMDGLNFADAALRQAVQQWITIVQATWYERILLTNILQRLL